MFYILNLIVLALVSGILSFQRYRSRTLSVRDEHTREQQDGGGTSLSQFEQDYFIPYVSLAQISDAEPPLTLPQSLVTSADWLQGPYLYTIYKQEKNMHEPAIAALFISGFMSAGISSLFVGPLADHSGRKKACLVYCVVSAASYLCVLSNSRALLFMGRVLGGCSATVQYSIFETWMVSEHGKQDMSETLPLSDILSFSVTLSGMLAIATGIIGEGLVRLTHRVTTPSVVAVCPLVLAFAFIFRRWKENYGSDLSEREWIPRARHIRRGFLDTRIAALAVISTLFEGSLGVFTVLWSPALISSWQIAQQGSSPPLGIAFSTLMCSMIVGSSVISKPIGLGTTNVARVLLSLLLVSACAALLPLFSRREWVIFQSFVLFESCVGAYFPVMAQLRSSAVADTNRGEIYALMRLPINSFVVLILGLKGEHDDNSVWLFSVMSASMFFAVSVTRYCLM